MLLPQTPFYMIRHGETEANKAEIMAGSNDSPLTQHGRNQAKAVQHVVNNLREKPKIIIHSHLSRAHDTASIINEALGVPMIEDERIAELHAGDWEGVSYDLCRPLLTGWDNPPNGETFDAFTNRVHQSVSNILKKKNKKPLIVCHGGVMRAFGMIYGLRTPGIFQNAHLYEFTPSNHPIFPWNVYHYERKKGNEDNIIKTQSYVYTNSIKSDSAIA